MSSKYRNSDHHASFGSHPYSHKNSTHRFQQPKLHALPAHRQSERKMGLSPNRIESLIQQSNRIVEKTNLFNDSPSRYRSKAIFQNQRLQQESEYEPDLMPSPLRKPQYSGRHSTRGPLGKNMPSLRESIGESQRTERKSAIEPAAFQEYRSIKPSTISFDKNQPSQIPKPTQLSQSSSTKNLAAGYRVQAPVQDQRQRQMEQAAARVSSQQQKVEHMRSQINKMNEVIARINATEKVNTYMKKNKNTQPTQELLMIHERDDEETVIGGPAFHKKEIAKNSIRFKNRNQALHLLLEKHEGSSNYSRQQARVSQRSTGPPASHYPPPPSKQPRSQIDHIQSIKNQQQKFQLPSQQEGPRSIAHSKSNKALDTSKPGTLLPSDSFSFRGRAHLDSENPNVHTQPNLQTIGNPNNNLTTRPGVLKKPSQVAIVDSLSKPTFEKPKHLSTSQRPLMSKKSPFSYQPKMQLNIAAADSTRRSYDGKAAKPLKPLNQRNNGLVLPDLKQNQTIQQQQFNSQTKGDKRGFESENNEVKAGVTSPDLVEFGGERKTTHTFQVEAKGSDLGRPLDVHKSTVVTKGQDTKFGLLQGDSDTNSAQKASFRLPGLGNIIHGGMEVKHSSDFSKIEEPTKPPLKRRAEERKERSSNINYQSIGQPSQLNKDENALIQHIFSGNMPSSIPQLKQAESIKNSPQLSPRSRTKSKGGLFHSVQKNDKLQGILDPNEEDFNFKGSRHQSPVASIGHLNFSPEKKNPLTNKAGSRYPNIEVSGASDRGHGLNFRSKKSHHRLKVPDTLSKGVNHSQENDAKDLDSVGELDVNARLQMIQTSMQADLEKIEKLSLINASARFELISANSQLIDFQMNRYIKHAQQSKKQLDEQKQTEHYLSKSETNDNSETINQIPQRKQSKGLSSSIPQDILNFTITPDTNKPTELPHLNAAEKGRGGYQSVDTGAQRQEGYLKAKPKGSKYSQFKAAHQQQVPPQEQPLKLEQQQSAIPAAVPPIQANLGPSLRNLQQFRYKQFKEDFQNFEVTESHNFTSHLKP